ncbi:MAG: ABC transporter permease [Isosphaeraceae bacterium]|nr:ABC transporter permease [Isosphaeraceae bacterium]
MSGWVGLDFWEIWRFRELMLVLAGRDLKLRYKQTALGVLWVVLQPLLSAGIFAFVFGAVARLPSGGRPYFLFSFAGLLGWKLFSTTLNQSGLSLLDNTELITKIYFPRLVLPAYTGLAALVDFTVALAILGGLYVVYGVAPGPALFLLPLWIAVLLMLALGGGLVCSTLIVRYRDVKHVMTVVTQMLLYASPVAYAVSAVPSSLRGYYYLNPLAAPLEALRWSLLGTAPPPLVPLLVAVGLAVAIFVCGVVWFQTKERTFADTI